jgi:cation diffusion facilitator CzcD-associated flavoprotein CzcO
VIVVGNGCSANQFVPHLVNETSVRNVAQVVRSSHWIAPKNDSVVSQWNKRSVSSHQSNKSSTKKSWIDSFGTSQPLPDYPDYGLLPC